MAVVVESIDTRPPKIEIENPDIAWLFETGTELTIPERVETTAKRVKNELLNDQDGKRRFVYELAEEAIIIGERLLKDDYTRQNWNVRLAYADLPAKSLENLVINSSERAQIQAIKDLASSPVFTQLTAEMRALPVENAVEMVLTENDRVLLQVDPDVGLKDSVQQNLYVTDLTIFGTRLLATHNHPLEPHTSEDDPKDVRFNYFSGNDYQKLFDKNAPAGMAVVSEDMTVLLFSTPESRQLLFEMNPTGDEYKRLEIKDRIVKTYKEMCPDETDPQREAFAVEFARKYQMRLAIIPAGHPEQVKILN